VYPIQDLELSILFKYFPVGTTSTFNYLRYALIGSLSSILILLWWSKSTRFNASLHLYAEHVFTDSSKDEFKELILKSKGR
jgi:hypothetical protein